MAFICNGLSGNGWMRKVGEVFQNQQNQFFFKCISYNCDAKFDSSEELTSHVRLKHADTTNQFGAPVTPRFPEQNHFIPAPFNPTQPPPPIPSIGVAGHNNGNLVGTTVSDAATVPAQTMPAQHLAVQNPITQKIEVKKKEEHLPFPYKCTGCQKVFGNGRRLREHESTCSDKPFRCAFCKCKFDSIQGKYGHERNIHADILKHPCSECNRAFERSSNLDAHKRRIHTNPSIKCDFCPKKLCTQFGKKFHLKKEHSNRRYYCRLCKEYSAASDSTISKHYIEKHGGIPKHGI